MMRTRLMRIRPVKMQLVGTQVVRRRPVKMQPVRTELLEMLMRA